MLTRFHTSRFPAGGRLLLALTALGLLQLAAAPPAKLLRLLEPEKNILFLGDSITAGGTYIAYIQAYLLTQYPEQNFRLINLGLSSETASGLSEPDHPFPRPCIHSRIDRVLAEAKPDVSFICYGMNDAIYYPISEDRFDAYKDGMRRLIEKVKAANSKVVLLTPPLFDAETRRLKNRPLQPADAEEYGFKTPYEHYDEVLQNYGRWVLDLKDEVDLVIDIHQPMERAVATIRAYNPKYLSGDSVHPNAAGHFVMAQAILKALDAPGVDQLPNYAELPASDPLADPLKLILKRHNLLSSAWREHVGHSRPGNSKAPPLDKAILEAAALEKEIREAIEPASSPSPAVVR